MGIQEESEEITEGGMGQGFARQTRVAGQRAGPSEEKEERVQRGRAESEQCSWTVRSPEPLERVHG